MNPHLPPEPEKVEEPEKPEDRWDWTILDDDEKEKAKEEFPKELERWQVYQQACQDRLASPEILAAPKRLRATVANLERRGLLQYDHQKRHWDLHPVVRGVAAGGLGQGEKERLGQRAVDWFSQQSDGPYDQAQTLDDLRQGLRLVHTFTQMGRYRQAFDTYFGALGNALFFNLEAHNETLALLRPFFPPGWERPLEALDDDDKAYLANDVGGALAELGEQEAALTALGASLRIDIKRENWPGTRVSLSNIAGLLAAQSRLAAQARCGVLALDLATELDAADELYRARLDRFGQLAQIGDWPAAEALWRQLSDGRPPSNRGIYRPGDTEGVYARFQFWQGNLQAESLTQALQAAGAGNNRGAVRHLHALSGEWRLQRGEPEMAAEALHEAVRMAREVGQVDAASETWLALANQQLGRLAQPRPEAERLAALKQPAHRPLAELWLAIGDPKQAKQQAQAAYEWAWADGEPYVFRYELEQSRMLLERLGEPIPNLLPYDPAKDEPFPWEADIRAVIEKLKAEKAAQQRDA